MRRNLSVESSLHLQSNIKCRLHHRSFLRSFPKLLELHIVMMCLQAPIEGPPRPSIHVLSYSTKLLVLSVCKVLMISVPAKLWEQILYDHWFWNLAFSVCLKLRTSLITSEKTRKVFSNAVLPKKGNRGTKSTFCNSA